VTDPEDLLGFWFPDLSDADHARMVGQREPPAGVTVVGSAEARR